MLTRSEVSELAQGPLDTLQRNTFSPMLNPLTALLGWLGLAMVPVPLTKDQVPCAGTTTLLPCRVVLVFGVLGYAMQRGGFPIACLILGMILGPLMETYFLRAMRMSQGDPAVLFSSTIGNLLWVGLLLSLVFPYALAWWRRRGATG